MNHECAMPHHFLRLSPEDALLLWGILADFHAKAAGDWPRLERIGFDLEAMIRKTEAA